MGHLSIAKLRAAKLETDPFEYIVVPAFLGEASLKQINVTYPEISKGGSYPIESLKPGMAIKEVIDEFDGPEFERAVTEKFGVDLAGKPKMYSLRGWLRAKDGQIHTDSKDRWPASPPAQWNKPRKFRNRGAFRQRDAARLQTGGQFVAWSSPVRGSTPGIADELDDQRGQ